MPPATVVDWLARVVEGHRLRPALVAERTWTFGETWERAGEVARALLDQPSFVPGAAVGLIGRNTPDWVVAYLGVMPAAGTVVPLNERLRPEEIREQLELVDACGVIECDLDEPTAAALPAWPVRELAGGGAPPPSRRRPGARTPASS